jgi:hypothetical protein
MAEDGGRTCIIHVRAPCGVPIRIDIGFQIIHFGSQRRQISSSELSERQLMLLAMATISHT